MGRGVLEAAQPYAAGLPEDQEDAAARAGDVEMGWTACSWGRPFARGAGCLRGARTAMPHPCLTQRGDALLPLPLPISMRKQLTTSICSARSRAPSMAIRFRQS